mgnify:CR=1 FL=1
MRLKTAFAQAASVLALCLLPGAWAQGLESAAATAASTRAESPAAAVPRRLEQVWEVVDIMGQPLGTQQRQARVALRGQGGLLVDGGCNYFSGRFEHDAQGQFRVSKYSGTHGRCEAPPRSEALLNSALVLVNGYRWDDGLVLSSEQGDLVRLRPSANQDTQEIEQALAQRASGAACQPAKAGRSHRVKGRARRVACQPAQAAAAKATAGKGARGGKAVAKSQPVAKAAAKPAAHSRKRRH